MVSNKKKVLLVEDVDSIREIYAELLSGEYTIIPAANGERALELLEQERPDLVVLDLHMPGIGGQQVYLELRKKAHLLHLPVIFVTGSIFEINETKNDPFSSTLFKPFKVIELKNEILKFLPST